MYVWRKKGDGCYWSDRLHYWADIFNATYFTAEEAAKITPGEDEEVIPLWQVTEIQLIRLIAECEAAGVFAAAAEEVGAAADSMGLYLIQFEHLVARAQLLWEKLKGKLPGRKLEAVIPNAQYRFKITFEQVVHEEAEVIIATDIPLDDRHLAGTLVEDDWFPEVDAQNPHWVDNCTHTVEDRCIERIEKLSPDYR